MKPQMLSDFFDRFKDNTDAQNLARDSGFKDIDEVIEVDRASGESGDPRSEEFHEYLIELISECPEEVDWMELECLSSYSTTTEFHLREFCGVYWIDNMEMGGIGYFGSEEDAKTGFKEQYGIEWGSEESPFSGEVTISDDLFDDDED